MARTRSPDKRRRILDAAVGVFARKGYFAARVSDVAKKAGVADGTIYLYFKSKEDILVRLFDEVMSEHVEEAREAVRALSSAPERLQAIAERHLAVLGENRDLAVVFQVELRQSTRFMERFTASWLHDYFELLDEVMEQGSGTAACAPTSTASWPRRRCSGPSTRRSRRGSSPTSDTRSRTSPPRWTSSCGGSAGLAGGRGGGQRQVIS